MELERGEYVIFEGHPSWRSILGFYLKGLLTVVLGGAAAAVATRIADDEVDSRLVTLVVALIAIVRRRLRQRLFTTYTISNDRLHIRRGIIARAEQQTQINRVQNVNTHPSVLQRMLQIGDVSFDTADPATTTTSSSAAWPTPCRSSPPTIARSAKPTASCRRLLRAAEKG